jgi:hypothetical protein
MTPMELIDKHIDVTGATHVEFQIRYDGAVIWLNVDGVCLVRICRIEKPIQIIDERGLPL